MKTFEIIYYAKTCNIKRVAAETKAQAKKILEEVEYKKYGESLHQLTIHQVDEMTPERARLVPVVNNDNDYSRPVGSGLGVVHRPEDFEASIPHPAHWPSELVFKHSEGSEMTRICDRKSDGLYDLFIVNTALLCDLAHAFLVHCKDKRVNRL